MVHCDRCDRYFQYWSSYQQHVSDSSNHHICDDCDKDFDTWRGLEQHYIQSPRHHYCRQCDTHFDDDEELEEHCIEEHYYCDRCNKFFQGANGLHEHNRQSHHYCVECRRVFNSESNLRAHMKSSVHQPRNVPCAFQHRGCTQFFVSKSAMILHLESGACPSGADRRMIDRWVRVNDPEPQYIATERSWNGSAYECILCHNTFRTLDDLNRHLASPKHQGKIYHCPLSTCLTRFNTLSGLCQHVESESCGVLRFRAARDGMEYLLSDMGRLRILATS
ncbi:hypothetical protein OG21DRAFT_1099906 [Imleria badia]|nr:hypothetical protein OG21DRAFT_1099906 [Imleria badia]